MLRFRRSCFNGVQDLFFIHGFRQLTLYSTTSIESNPNFVNYLVENLGYSKQQALSTSSKFTRGRLRRNGAKKVSDFDFVNNVDSVVAFLKKNGLEQSQIRNVIDYSPLILMCKVDKTLTPKTEAFQKLGFTKPIIAEVVSNNPTLLFMGLDTTIIPTIEALREIMGCEAHVISMLKKLRCSHLNVIPKYLVPNVALLQSFGIPLESIRKMILLKPSAVLRKTDGLKNAVTRVEVKLGISRDSRQFLNGVQVISSLTDKSLESKLQVYKSFGWTDAVLATHLSLNPMALSKSNDNIEKKLDFFMNEMGYKPSYLTSRSNLFSCSLEKRILPRHKVLLVLKENGLMREISLPNVVGYSESKFLKKFVLPFKEVHEVYSKFSGINLETLTLGSPKPNSIAL